MIIKRKTAITAMMEKKVVARMVLPLLRPRLLRLLLPRRETQQAEHRSNNIKHASRLRGKKLQVNISSSPRKFSATATKATTTFRRPRRHPPATRTRRRKDARSRTRKHHRRDNPATTITKLRESLFRHFWLFLVFRRSNNSSSNERISQ